jgi:hypothetical protein
VNRLQRRSAHWFNRLLAAAWLLSAACGNDALRRTGEQVEVVGGSPTVGQGLPHVDRADGGTPQFGSAAPYQVDGFQQPLPSKVDILWVIDNSYTMKAKQDRVKANFVAFFQQLQQQHIDYHLGVVTTDVFDPLQSGRLVDAAGLAVPWIDASASDPQVSFVANATVGTAGSHDARPLLAGMLALTAPLSPALPASPRTGALNCADGSGGPVCFLRPDAPLYTIVVSDREDSSCSPINANTEGCDDAQATLSGFGPVAYWSRFFAGIKGAGGTSRVAAIVATDSTTYQCADVFAHLCDPYNLASPSVCGGGAAPNCNIGSASHPCCQALRSCYNDLVLKAPYCGFSVVTDSNQNLAQAPYYRISSYFNGCVSQQANGTVDFAAWSAARTVQVAQATGGVATSICDTDYTAALQKLGLQAAGLLRDFPLSRTPQPASLAVTVAGQPVAAGAATWQYLGCQSPTPPGPGPHLPANVIRFATPPAPGAKVTAAYSVDVHGLGACP